MIRRPPRSTQSRSSAASDVYKRQVREEILFHAYHEHHRELDTLGVMQGHQSNHSGFSVQRICIRVEADLLEKSVQGTCRVDTVVFSCYSYELLQVLKPSLSLHSLLRAKIVRHAALLEYILGQPAQTRLPDGSHLFPLREDSVQLRE